MSLLQNSNWQWQTVSVAMQNSSSSIKDNENNHQWLKLGYLEKCINEWQQHPTVFHKVLFIKD